MRLLPILAACAVAALPAGAAAAAEKSGHDAYLASVATYRPMQGFNHVVGDRQFVGYFLVRNGGCAVTLMTAVAGDEELKTPPQRLRLDIAAADRAEVPAGESRVLAIVCTADADAIKVVPLTRPLLKTASR